VTESREPKKWNKWARRVPGHALTREQWLELGYGEDGEQERPLTDDPIGTYKHPRPGGGAE
jgi:hypothetical protein